MCEKENLKKRIPEIKTLAMLKMEKNFIALNEKEYLGFTPNKYRFINVGVDVWNYYPITINEIIKAYKNKYGEI